MSSARLRDIFDGRHSRDVGVDGGKRLEWDGHHGLIGAATTALDRHHAVLTALGERWLTVRIPEAGEQEMVRLALKTRDTAGMRSTLREVVSSFFAGLGEGAMQMRELHEDEERLIVSLSSLVCRARSPVDRDAYSREIVLVHGSEGPVRIARQLQKLTCALGAMGLDHEAVRETVTKIGLDHPIPTARDAHAPPRARRAENGRARDDARSSDAYGRAYGRGARRARSCYPSQSR